MSFTPLIRPVALILGALLVGWICERVLLRRFSIWAAQTERANADVIFTALRGVILFWWVLAGIYVALRTAPIYTQAADFFIGFVRLNVVFSLTWAFIKIATGLLNRYTATSERLFASTTIFRTVLRIVIVSIGGLIVLHSLGFAATPALTTLGVGGIAIALAVQDTLANLFAGVYILVSKKIVPSDYIRLDTGDEGYVTDINWRSTTIKALANTIIIVPNAKIASAVVTNYDLPVKELTIVINLSVSCDSDLDHVERITIEVAKAVMQEVGGGVPEFDPFLRYTTIADVRIQFTVILRSQQFVEQFRIKHEVIKRLHQRYREERIEVSGPAA